MQWKSLLWSLNSALNLLLYCILTVWSLHWDFFIFWSSNRWNQNLIEISQWLSTLVCVVIFLITVVVNDIKLISIICRLFCKFKLSIILALHLLLTECMTVVQIRFWRSFLFVRRLKWLITLYLWSVFFSKITFQLSCKSHQTILNCKQILIIYQCSL